MLKEYTTGFIIAMTDMLDITRTSAILLLKLDLLSECLQIQNYVEKTVADPALPPRWRPDNFFASILILLLS